MPRVNTVKKARKNYPDHGIKKGDTYYWWKFPYGSAIKSKKYPKRSQLTRSGYYASIYDMQDDFVNPDSIEDLEATRDNLVDELNNLKDEAEESLSNMPEHLQDSSASGEMLTERIERLDEVISELESIDMEVEDEEEELEGKIEEVTSALGNLE